MLTTETDTRINSPHDHLSESERVWHTLYERRMPQLARSASSVYLDGLHAVQISSHRVPVLEAINRQLAPLTGWRAVPAAGFLPAAEFFDSLARREFPTVTRLRKWEELDYTPEPDIFHDVFGHVPMHAHKVFADFLEHYGRVCASISDAGVLEKLGRLFWYTVEFGLIREGSEFKVYGSGLISSHCECTNVISGNCAIHNFSLDEVLTTPVKVDQLHKLLFALSSFDQMYEAMHEAEQRAMQGQL